MILAVWVRITSIVSYPGHTPSTQFSQRVAGRASSPPVLEERVCQHGRSVGTGEPGKGVLFEACQFQPSDGMPVDMGYSWTGQGLPAAEYAVDRGLCHAWALHLLVAVARFVPSPRGGGFSVAGRAARDVSWNPCPRRGSAGGARRSDLSINRHHSRRNPVRSSTQPVRSIAQPRASWRGGQRSAGSSSSAQRRTPGNAATRDGVRIRNDLLAKAAGLASGWRLGTAAPSPARRTRRAGSDRLVSRCVGRLSDSGKKGGERTGPNPTDRGRPGSKHHATVDRNGIPRAVGLTAANVNDSVPFERMLDAVPPNDPGEAAVGPEQAVWRDSRVDDAGSELFARQPRKSAGDARSTRRHHGATV
jgi:hypothetical protein